MQNTSTSRSTDFRRQKTITSKTPLTLYGRGFCASDGTPTTTGSPAGPQSNQNVWVLPPISRNAHFQQDETRCLLNRCHHESHQAYSLYQLVSHLGTSTTLFPAIWTKTARSIEELFSQGTRPKRASSDQRTDEEDTSETCNNNDIGGRALTNAYKRN